MTLRILEFLYYRRRNRAEIDRRIEEVYRLFPILERRAKQVAGTLSGGEQQMLAIARALMGRPELTAERTLHGLGTDYREGNLGGRQKAQ